MLDKRENEVMRAVYSLCGDSGRCLVSPAELRRILPLKAQGKCTEERLEKTLRALELDDYFELLSTDRKGEKMYVITLHANGFAFRRAGQQLKRNFAAKIVWAVLSAVVAFLVGVVLKKIF